MKKRYLTFLFILFGIYTFAQIGINRTNPRGILDLNHNESTIPNTSTMGLVLPSNLAGLITTPNPVLTPKIALGTTIYDTAGKCVRVYNGNPKGSPVGWSDCLLDTCVDPTMKNSVVPLPNSPLVINTVGEEGTKNNFLFSGNGQASVGVGRAESRGVLDLNFEGDRSPYGLVLPSNSNLNNFRTPFGTAAIEGTLVYDLSVPCIRFKHNSGWSDCLKREEECTFIEKEPPYDKGVRWASVNNIHAYASNLTTSVDWQKFFTADLISPSFYGPAGGPDNHLKEGLRNTAVPTINPIVQIQNIDQLPPITSHSVLDYAYLKNNFDVYSFSPDNGTPTKEAHSRIAIDIFEKFIDEGGVGIVAFNSVGGGVGNPNNINNYLLKKYNYPINGVTTATGNNKLYLSTTNNSINNGVFGDVRNKPFLKGNVPEGTPYSSNYMYMPLSNLEGRDDVEILATTSYGNGNSERGVVAWFGGPGKRILFLNSKMSVNKSSYNTTYDYGPNYNRNLIKFHHNMISYLLSRKGLPNDAP